MSEWNKKLASYVIALYKIGDYTDAALIGSIMFEKAVYRQLEEKGISNQFDQLLAVENKRRKRKGERNRGQLEYAIIKMCEVWGYDTQFEKRIDKIRDLRNDIIHRIEINEISRDHHSLIRMISFVWYVFNCGGRVEPGILNQFNEIISKINFLDADYEVMGVRELLDIQDIDYEKFSKFDLKDFQELYKLREKFVSLSDKLSKDNLLKQNKIKIDILSKIDTTSGYVWLSMYQDDGQDDGQEIKRIGSASVSILGTPLDLRIYIDFGGDAIQERQYYYSFLMSDNFKNYWTENDKIDIKIFDIDWFCFIVKETSLEHLLLDSYNLEHQIRNAEKKLEPYLKNKKKQKKISWNRMLCGYIINRPEIGGEISYSEIINKLDKIIQFYNFFENYLKINKVS